MPEELEVIDAEVIPDGDLNEFEAKEAFKLLDETIGNAITVAEHMERAVAVIFKGRAWLALGYPTFEKACDVLLKDRMAELSTAKKKQFMDTLSAAGLSVRAIAAATGVSRETARRQVTQTGSPATPTKGLDGKTYTQPPKKNTPKPAPEDHGFRDAVLAFRGEGYTVEQVADALTPKVTRSQVREVTKGMTFEPVDHLVPLAASSIDWKSGDWEIPKSSIDPYDKLMQPWADILKTAREKRHLNASGHAYLQRGETGVAKYKTMLDEVKVFISMLEEVLGDTEAAEVVRDVIEPGTAAEDALKDWESGT